MGNGDGTVQLRNGKTTAFTNSWVGRSAGRLGILILDYADRFPEGLTDLAAWLKQGRIRYREDIVQGLENAPTALTGLYQGKNTGKILIRLPDPADVGFGL